MASSNVSAYRRARHRDTSLRNVSPIAIPRTPPAGLRNAVRRKRRVQQARSIVVGVRCWGRAELVCSNACCREQGSPAPGEEATHSLEQRLASG